MRKYTPTINGRPIDTIPYLVASDLGVAREHLFFRNGKQVKNLPPDKSKEVFCSFESYATQPCGLNKIHFWMHRTEKLAQNGKASGVFRYIVAGAQKQSAYSFYRMG